MQARNSFLQSLDFQVQEPVPVPAAPASYAAAAPRGVASTGAAAGYAQGNGAVAQLRQQQPSRSASPGPAAQSAGGPPAPPPPPPQLNKPAPQLAMPVRAPVATNGLEGNISGTLPGTVPVPENLAPIGRKGTAEGKVRDPTHITRARVVHADAAMCSASSFAWQGEVQTGPKWHCAVRTSVVSWLVPPCNVRRSLWLALVLTTAASTCSTTSRQSQR